MSFVNMCRLPTHLGRHDRPGFYRGTSTSRRDSPIKYEPIRAKSLWLRVVFAYTLVAVLGIVFVILGSVYVRQAYVQETTTLPLLICILAIVAGLTMLFGSFILGKMFISKKTRQHHLAGRGRRISLNRVTNGGNQDSGLTSEPPPPYTPYGDPSVYQQPNEPQPEEMSRSPSSLNTVIPPPDYCMEPPTYIHQPPSYAESTAEVHMMAR